MDTSPALLAIIGLLLALWTAGAVWVMLRATGREQKSVASRKAAQRLSRMIEEGPAIPMLVRADGRIEAPDRLARWIGLEKVPDYLSELAGADGEGWGLCECSFELRLSLVRLPGCRFCGCGAAASATAAQ